MTERPAPGNRAVDQLVPIRVTLNDDRKAWRLWGTAYGVCSLVTLAGIALGGSVAYGAVTGVAVTAISVLLLSPLLWLARFTSFAARADAWIDVSSACLIVHHPAFLSEDLLIDRDVVHSFFVGELPGHRPPPAPHEPVNTAWKRLRAHSRALDEEARWRPPVRPSGAAPDLASVSEEPGWNFALILQRSFFLAGTPRRSISVVRFLSRGAACAFAPKRNYWIRGFFAVVQEPERAAAILASAGVPRSELTPEVLGWLRDAGPAPLGRAWRNYWRDRRRREPGPSHLGGFRTGSRGDRWTLCARVLSGGGRCGGWSGRPSACGHA